jgi:hypothetical protein
MPKLRMVLMGTTVCWAVVACAQVIDLGDEATLADESSTGGTGGGSQYPCGIPPAASPTCNACWEANCCAEALACAAEPQCLEASEALEDCLYEVSCILQVNVDYADAPAFGAYSECIAACGTQCMPTGDCLALAECCQQTTEQFLRDACFAIIAGEDQTECRTRLDNEFSQYCQ